MYKIDNMSIKEYLIDRAYIFFKPLLCCTTIGKNHKKNPCDSCGLEIFSNGVVEILRSHPYYGSSEVKTFQTSTPIVHTVNILPTDYINILRNR